MAAHLHSLSDILNRKKTFSDVPKTIFWLKTRFKMIYFLLDKVIRYTQMPVDCLWVVETRDSRVYVIIQHCLIMSCFF